MSAIKKESSTTGVLEECSHENLNNYNVNNPEIKISNMSRAQTCANNHRNISTSVATPDAYGAATLQKKRPGRPRKVKCTNNSSSVSNPSNSDTILSDSSDFVPEKKIRLANTDGKVVGQKKKRGRPRKKLPSNPSIITNQDESDNGSCLNLKSFKKEEPCSTDNQDGPITCMRCNCTVENFQKMQYHMMSTHTAIFSYENPMGDESIAAQKIILKKLHKLLCTKCGKYIKNHQYYMHHTNWCGREDEVFECPICCKEVKMMWQTHHLNYHISAQKKMQEASMSQAEAEEMANAPKDTRRKSAHKAKTLLKNFISEYLLDTDKTRVSGGSEDDDYNASEDENMDDHIDVDNDDNKDETERRNKAKRVPKTLKHRQKNLLTSDISLVKDITNVASRLQTHFDMLMSLSHDIDGIVFPHFVHKPSSWVKVPPSVYDDYLPTTRRSCLFSISRRIALNRTMSTCAVQSLELFQSSHLTDVLGERITVFVGGPIWAMSWCPTPQHLVHDQYLALACHHSMDDVHSDSTTFSGPGIIQIWHFADMKYGRLKKGSMMPTPLLSLCIQHENGCVFDMVWCPRAAFSPSQPDSMSDQVGAGISSRLGLLAVAFSNGTIEIFSIPHPRWLDSENGDHLPIYRAQPVLKLIPTSGPDSCCLSVSWQTGNQCRMVAAAYGSGDIYIWDLMSQSPLLNISGPSRTMYPCHALNAHHPGRTKVMWATTHGNRLVTCGHDHNIKIWDITCTMVREVCMKRGPVVSIDALYDTHKIFYTLDSVSPDISGSHSVGFDASEIAVRTVLPNSVGITWDITYSPWLQKLVSCDEHGTVCGITVTSNRPTSNPFLLYQAQTVGKKEYTSQVAGDDKTSAVNSNGDSHQTNKSAASCGYHSNEDIAETTNSSETYEECVKRTILSLKDSTVKSKFVYRESTSHMNLDSFPLASVNKVLFNPNLSSCTWLASGSTSGLLQLHNLPVLSVTAHNTLAKLTRPS